MSKITENTRIYTYPGNQKITIKNARSLFVSDSGNHRIQTKGGMLHILPIGWLHIEIDSKVGKWEV